MRFFGRGVGGSRGSGNLETVKNFRRRPTGKLFGTKSWWKQVSTEMRKNQKWPDHVLFFGPKVPHTGGSAVAQKIKGRASKGSFLSQKVGRKMWRYFLGNVKNAPKNAFFRSGGQGVKGVW